MGCSISNAVFGMKRNKVAGRALGSGLNRSDVNIPLSEAEVYTIMRSWRSIRRNMASLGLAMFVKMFQEHEDIKLIFEQFRSMKEVKDMRANKDLQNHALLVMYTLDDIISSLDDQEYVVDLLLRTGKSHRRFQNFQANTVWAIEDPFLSAMKQAFGRQFNSYVNSMYTKTIRFILSTLELGFNEDL